MLSACQALVDNEQSQHGLKVPTRNDADGVVEFGDQFARGRLACLREHVFDIASDTPARFARTQQAKLSCLGHRLRQSPVSCGLLEGALL